MNLEIGGGTNRLWPDAAQLDPVHGDHALRIRMQDDLPCDLRAAMAGTFDKAIASHVMEHIPAGVERIAALNNVHALLKPGGTFEIIVPCVGYTDHERGGAPIYAGWQAWADPTHCSYWFYPESFWYLTGRYAAHASYGLSPWDEGPMVLLDGWEAHATLVKPNA